MIANANEILDASTIESSRIEYKADWNVNSKLAKLLENDFQS